MGFDRVPTFIRANIMPVGRISLSCSGQRSTVKVNGSRKGLDATPHSFSGSMRFQTRSSMALHSFLAQA